MRGVRGVLKIGTLVGSGIHRDNDSPRLRRVLFFLPLLTLIYSSLHPTQKDTVSIKHLTIEQQEAQNALKNVTDFTRATSLFCFYE